MKLENEDALDNLIICEKCFTLHEEVPIHDGNQARCTKCKSILYRYDTQLLEHGLALSFTGFIFFVITNLFPLVKIEILGHSQFITLSKTFMSLFDNGFYLVGILCLFLIFIFPLMIVLINVLLFSTLKLKRGKNFSKSLLILLAHIKPWSMSDIFLVSILVALVKLIGYADIHMGLSFWALIIFVLIDLYISRNIHISEIWMLRKGIFRDLENDRNIS
jgi:paraquat-inducible protein A